MSALSSTTRVPSPPPLLPLYRFTTEQFHDLTAAGILAPDETLELHDGLIVVRNNGSLPPVRFSPEQYQRMIAAGILPEDTPVELLNGWIVTKMARNPPHDSALCRTQVALNRRLPPEWIARGQSGMTTEASQPEPDLAVVLGPPERYDDHHPTAQELAVVIEIADSTVERDRSFKGLIYAQAGIPVYWIVNIPDARVEVFTAPVSTPDGAEYRQRRDYAIPEDVPLVLAGNEVARIPVNELLPRPARN